jgi:hypothetical protein
LIPLKSVLDSSWWLVQMLNLSEIQCHLCIRSNLTKKIKQVKNATWDTRSCGVPVHRVCGMRLTARETQRSWDSKILRVDGHHLV